MPRRCYLLHDKYWRRRLKCLRDLLHYSKSIGAVKAVCVIGKLTKKVQHIGLCTTTIIYFAVAFGCSWQTIATQCARLCRNTGQSYSLPQRGHHERWRCASQNITPNESRTSTYSYFTLFLSHKIMICPPPQVHHFLQYSQFLFCSIH